jgi:hypothetical protein
MGLGTAAAALVSSSSAQTGRVPSPSNLEQALPSSLPGTVRPFSASSVGKINPGLCFIGHFGPRIKKKIKISNRTVWKIHGIRNTNASRAG